MLLIHKDLVTLTNTPLMVVDLTSKVLKKNEACKVKIAAIEDFALDETFFALADSLPAPQIHSLTYFQPQFTHFKQQQPPMKWQNKPAKHIFRCFGVM